MVEETCPCGATFRAPATLAGRVAAISWRAHHKSDSLRAEVTQLEGRVARLEDELADAHGRLAEAGLL